MLTDTDKRFIQAVADEVRETGLTHVYDISETGECSLSACTYVNYRDGGTEPSCIIGRGLVRSGLMTVEQLKDYEGDRASNVLDRARLGLSNEVHRFSNRVQSYQDSGYTWGEALNAGFDRLTDYGIDPEQFME